MSLERVTEGMAEIEQSARAARLPLVRLDDLCLGAGARLDGMTPLAALAREHIRPILLEPGKERCVAEKPVLHHFCIAGAELARAQGREHRNVGDDQARLIEGADQILALSRVDARLAANRRVDLGEQAR